jgi:hypothetical protein
MFRIRSAYPTAGVLLVAAIAVAGCASTSLIDQWKSPSYSGPPLKKVLVVGVSTQPGPRRIFEDEFSAALKAAGVDAVPSYTVISEDGRAEQAVLEQAIKDVGADGVLVTRLVKTEQKTQISPGYYRPVPTVGFYGWYSSAWVGYYEPPTVYQYDVVTAETSVYGLNVGELVWSGITETFAPEDVKKETQGFAKVIIEALKKQGLI